VLNRLKRTGAQRRSLVITVFSVPIFVPILLLVPMGGTFKSMSNNNNAAA
jgi:hypothetical protein